MKTTCKRILTAILCVAIAITTSIGANTAYAAGKKLPLKVTFNGATATLVEDFKADISGTMKTVEAKWGKPNAKEKLDFYDYTRYVWKKGKTTITINDRGDGFVGSIELDIYDKNGAIGGVKAGMKVETALKKLYKIYGKKNVAPLKEGQYAEPEKDAITITGKATGKEIIRIAINSGEYMPVSISIENGKVSSMHFFRS